MQAARAAEQQAASRRRGRASTIRTGPAGVLGVANLGQKTLLGQ